MMPGERTRCLSTGLPASLHFMQIAWDEFLGRSASMEFVVAEEHTAAVVGSGVVPVLGTPVLVAWLEATTLQVAEVPAHQVSVGVHVDVAHLAASPIGARVQCRAELTDVRGLRMTFAVAAVDVADGRELAKGSIDRVVVDRERFLASL